MASEPVPPADFDDSQPLEPPGSIAVIGGGPLGIEAALYGRFLGYDVTLFEASEIGRSLIGHEGERLPMVADRCLSSLALSALEAQYPERSPWTFPETIGQWVHEVLQPLSETDLLRGRVRVPLEIVSIETVAAGGSGEATVADEEEDSDEIPPDFRLHGRGETGRPLEQDFEAVVLAIGTAEPPELKFPLPAAYFFRIGERPCEDAEVSLHEGWRDIVSVFATLAGRAELDLYRPRRL